MKFGLFGGFRRGKMILVIPDVHFQRRESAEDADRLLAISKLILQLKPDVVVVLGDLQELASCADWIDRVDGAEAVQDAGAFKIALMSIMREARAANARHRSAGHPERLYEPVLVCCEGNHEQRWRRRKETKMLGHDHLQRIAEAEGWEWVPFLKIRWIDGIGFSHFMQSGTMGKAAAITTMLQGACSFFGGHKHSREIRTRVRTDGSRYTVGDLGCFKSPGQVDPTKGEWSGLTVLSDVTGGGACAVHELPYDQLLERYGEAGYAQELRSIRAYVPQEERDLADLYA